MDHDVEGLILGTFSGDEADSFERGKGTRLPFLLPKVMGGHPVKSESQLFRLPAEILGDIANLLATDKATLSNLALVNSDCRQLARSCQFAYVHFDYGARSYELYRHLAAGIDETSLGASGSATQAPSIGLCIRKVVVCSSPEAVARRHHDLYSSMHSDSRHIINHEERDRFRRTAYEQYLSYRNTLIKAIHLKMPHLEHLSWRDMPCVDEKFFKVLTNLPIRHLELKTVAISKAFRLEPPLTSSDMSLESICLDVRSCLDCEGADDTAEQAGLSPFVTTLLQRCRTTLRRLIFSHGEDGALSFGDEMIQLPLLKHLDLFYADSEPDETAWTSLTSGSPKHLAIPEIKTGAFAQLLGTCEVLRDLETLVIGLPDGDDNLIAPVIKFISRHPHISKLALEESKPKSIDLHILPLLTSGLWTNLTSLSLAWETAADQAPTDSNIVIISEESLSLIGRITSLEHLSMSAGWPIGWRCEWLVNHASTRSCLAGLTKLKRLAISRDTYQKPFDDQPQHYYSSRIVEAAERHDSMRRPDLDYVVASEEDDDYDVIWECAHRNRMLREAESYGAVFQDLSWVYCGQWPMEIERTLVPKAMPLSSKRDSCWSLLNQMFAMGDGKET